MIMVKVKKLSPRAALPAFATAGAAGADLCAIVDVPPFISIDPGEIKLIPTGVAVEVPEGYELQVRPRSGLAAKKGLSIVNTPGTVDSDYRGEIKVIAVNLGPNRVYIYDGDRIAQAVVLPVPKVEYVEFKELSATDRGKGGFGSTGVK